MARKIIEPVPDIFRRTAEVFLLLLLLLPGSLAVPGLQAETHLRSGSGVRVYRTMMPESGPSSFAVQLPGDFGFCYDPGRGGINYVWKGQFVDLAPTVAAKINQPARIQGQIFYRETIARPLRPAGQDKIPDYTFEGYRIGQESVVFHYRLGSNSIREEIQVLPDGRGILRRFRLAGGSASRFRFLTESQERALMAPDSQGSFIDFDLGQNQVFQLAIRQRKEAGP